MPELTRRYVVMTMAAAAPFDTADPDAPFVLKPWKDPAALQALKTYREHCYAELARDLDQWIQVIEAGPQVRGDIGRRNEEHLGSVRPAPARGPGRSGGRARKPKAAPARPKTKRAVKSKKRRR